MAHKCSLMLTQSNGFVFHSMPRHFGFGLGMLQNPKLGSFEDRRVAVERGARGARDFDGENLADVAKNK